MKFAFEPARVLAKGKEAKSKGQRARLALGPLLSSGWITILNCSQDQIEQRQADYKDFLRQRLIAGWFDSYPQLFC